MKNLRAIIWVMLLSLMSNQCVAALKAGEGIVRDPVTGDYTATYWDEDETGGEFVTAVLVSATKIDPKLDSNFKLTENLQVQYAYKLANGKKARQPIITFMLHGLSPEIVIANTQTFSNGDAKYQMDFFEAALSIPNSSWYVGGARVLNKELNIGWHYNRGDYKKNVGLQTGELVNGFKFRSPDLPGVGIAQLMGNTGYHGFEPLGEITSDIGRQMLIIERNDFVSRNTAIPAISIPIPFDAAVTLDRIRTHVATWPSKQLLDPALATQLDRYLVSAADAYRRNQLKAGKEHIETLRKMLEHEHKDLDHDDDENENGKRGEKNDDHRAVNQRILIDRLAARILDFDLRYVLKRTEREDDEHKKH